MDLEQLTGRYRRLKDELATAYGVRPWPAGQIDRLAQEIAEAEQVLFGGKAKPQRASRDGSQPAQVERHRITPFGQRTAEPAVK